MSGSATTVFERMRYFVGLAADVVRDSAGGRVAEGDRGEH
jgi:hypothetical protein